MVFGLAQALDAADGTHTSQAGAWNLTGSWSDGIIADGIDSTAFFTNDITAARTTSLGADRTIGHIVFTDADNTAGSDNAELRISNSANISNALEVRAGSSGTKTLSNRNPQSVTYSGTITADDNLAILLAGATGGSVFTINGADNSVAASKTVSFEISGVGEPAELLMTRSGAVRVAFPTPPTPPKVLPSVVPRPTAVVPRWVL